MGAHDRDHAAIRAGTLALRTAVAILGSREEAADLAHDVVVDVLRSLDQLREPEAFDAWVHTIAFRRTLRALRKRRGAGGKGHFGYATVAPNSELRENRYHGVLKLTLREASYDWELVTTPNGRVADSGTSNCH